MVKIMLNPGHCPGVDPGAVNKELGAKEADIARVVGYMLASYLEGSGYETKLVQDDSLEAITRAANNWEADYFVSIHCNAAYTDQAMGTETYCYEYHSEGQSLAECINNRIVRKMNMVDRGVKEANFYVLRHTIMPAVLVEMGFITNTEDCIKLLDKPEDFAEAIYKGILDYLEGEE